MPRADLNTSLLDNAKRNSSAIVYMTGVPKPNTNSGYETGSDMLGDADPSSGRI